MDFPTISDVQVCRQDISKTQSGGEDQGSEMTVVLCVRRISCAGNHGISLQKGGGPTTEDTASATHIP